MTGTPPPVVETTGVVHCHSTYSDGMGAMHEIRQAADAAGLDFLLMTDHDTLVPLQELGEAYYRRTLVLYGAEVSPRYNHYLVYNVTALPSVNETPQDIVDFVAQQGGIGFCAHPYDYGSKLLRLSDYTWHAWECQRITGLEIWNYFSGWVGSTTSLMRMLAGLFWWPLLTMAPDPRTLAKWDELGQRARVTGVGGVDAHGIRQRALGVTLVLHPYTRSFRTVRTHLVLPEPFTGNVDSDRQAVLGALRDGRCYVTNWEQGDPRPFRFAACQGDRWLEMGDEASAGETTFYAAIGAPADLSLLHNGHPVARGRGRLLTAKVRDPGVYRLEARRRGRAWTLSNPIYLR